MNEDSHVGGVAGALVLLAAVATTFTTYTYYNDDVLATQYEGDGAALEQTASALMSLRLEEEAMQQMEAASSTEETVEAEIELQ